MPIEKQKLAEIIEQHPYPVLRFSGEGRVLYSNAASMPVMLHLGVEVGDELPAEWREWVAEIIKSGLAKVTFLKSAGLDFEVTLAPSMDDHVNVFGRDVTLEVELEKERIAAAHFKAVSTMVTTYAHEISNPLTIAMGLLRVGLDEKQYTSILAALERIAQVLKEIRNLGEAELRFEDYSGTGQMVDLKKSQRS